MKKIDISEENTYNVLKGISEEEALSICNKVYADLIDEIGASNGLPIQVLRERSDFILKRYGWTYDHLFPIQAMIKIKGPQ